MAKQSVGASSSRPAVEKRAARVVWCVPAVVDGKPGSREAMVELASNERVALGNVMERLESSFGLAAGSYARIERETNAGKLDWVETARVSVTGEMGTSGSRKSMTVKLEWSI